MSERTYLQHGRRHAPGGTDPIPGLGGSSPVVASGVNFSGQSVPAGTTANSSFSNTAISSDTSKVSWTSSVSTNDTLVLEETGTAMLVASCKWSAGTAVDFKIMTGSGFEMFPHDAIKTFSGLGPVSSGSVLPTLMDICWVSSTAATLPIFVKMTNNDGLDSGPSDAYLACMFWPGLVV